jgi:type 1 glutamine amidotransferase
MRNENNPSRRLIVTGALAGVAGACAQTKKPGETRVLFLLGDYYHNAAMQEYAWRKVLKETGWRLMFAQAPSFVTPEVMAEADLYVLCRYATSTQPTNISLGWSPDKIVEERPAPDDFMSAEHAEMIASNLQRGMGLVGVHCTVWNPDNPRFLDLLGVEKPIMHGPVVPAHVFDLNQEHPITKGIEPFDIGIDEVFDAVMKTDEYTQLFRTRQEEPQRNAIGGWCREEGKGRVVALLPGHTTGPYGKEQFLELMWRSAHWAMNL